MSGALRAVWGSFCVPVLVQASTLTAGLSVARIGEVKDGCLVLHGADIVDGSPVLDIKPYLPYVDSVPSAQAPSWVR